MGYKERLQENNAELQSILDTVNELPESGESGASIPYLLDVTEYVHAEDWLTMAVGNAERFAKVYCNLEDTTDKNLYICYIENNNATSQQANYLMLQRINESGVASCNVRANWTNSSNNTISSRDFFITKGAKITVIRFKVGE